MTEYADLVKGIIILFLLIVINAIMYGFGSGIQAMSEVTVCSGEKEGKRKSARLLKLIENPSYLIACIHVASLLTGIAAGIYVVNVFAGILYGIMAGNFSEAPEILLQAGTMAASFLAVMYFMLAFGVVIPKRLGIKRSSRAVYALAGPAGFLMWIFSPFVWVILKTGELILGMVGISPYDEEEDVTEEEIINIVNEGQEQGLLQASEAEMINNIIEFAEKEAKDIMTHRKAMIALDADMVLTDALEYMLEQHNSRFPVYEDNLDNIIGILHLKNAMKCYSHPEFRNRPLKEIEGLVREANFIPETRNINVLFKNMQSQKIHMVIVVDEYGQTAGLVAMEDILEEIVGNILDEYDVDDSSIIEQADASYMMEGMTPLEEVADVLGLDFGNEDYETLNGFLISKIGRIPEEDEEFEIEHEGYRFHVMSVENKMIRSIHVNRIENDSAQEAEIDQETVELKKTEK